MANWSVTPATQASAIAMAIHSGVSSLAAVRKRGATELGKHSSRGAVQPGGRKAAGNAVRKWLGSVVEKAEAALDARVSSELIARGVPPETAEAVDVNWYESVKNSSLTTATLQEWASGTPLQQQVAGVVRPILDAIIRERDVLLRGHSDDVALAKSAQKKSSK